MKLTREALEKSVRLSFNRYYDEACTTVLSERPVDPARVFYLRPSSFPYCGVRKFLAWPEALEAEGLTHMDSNMLFYVTVGHAFHEVFQELLGKHGQLIGNWRCPRCKRVLEFTTYTRCKRCKIPMQYRELEVTYRRTLIGHVDGLYLDKKTKTYWVIDYKSTSSRALWFHRKKPKFPYKANVAQITAYVPLLEKIYGVPISGYMLVYLPRDNPFEAKLTCIKALSDKSKAKIKDNLKALTKIHRTVLTLTTLQEFKAVYANKLCTSAQDYDDNYRSDHNPCPHVKYCFTKSKMLAKAEEVIDKCRDSLPMISLAPSELQKAMRLHPDQVS